jgi:dihydroxy-acid dehydratase
MPSAFEALGISLPYPAPHMVQPARRKERTLRPNRLGVDVKRSRTHYRRTRTKKFIQTRWLIMATGGSNKCGLHFPGYCPRGGKVDWSIDDSEYALKNTVL